MDGGGVTRLIGQLSGAQLLIEGGVEGQVEGGGEGSGGAE